MSARLRALKLNSKKDLFANANKNVGTNPKTQKELPKADKTKFEMFSQRLNALINEVDSIIGNTENNKA